MPLHHSMTSTWLFDSCLCTSGTTMAELPATASASARELTASRRKSSSCSNCFSRSFTTQPCNKGDVTKYAV